MNRKILADAWHECTSVKEKLKELDDFYFSSVHEDTIEKLDYSLYVIGELLKGKI